MTHPKAPRPSEPVISPSWWCLTTDDVRVGDDQVEYVRCAFETGSEAAAKQHAVERGHYLTNEAGETVTPDDGNEREDSMNEKTELPPARPMTRREWFDGWVDTVAAHIEREATTAEEAAALLRRYRDEMVWDDE